MKKKVPAKTGFENEIWAYALRNALEHGRAVPGKVLPKLFNHGLKKEDVGTVMPELRKIVAKVDIMSDSDREETMNLYSKYLKEREESQEFLPALPGHVEGKKPVFRLAPFPSGALHIGNARTYMLNALYAEAYEGKVLLVMDDTIGSVDKPVEEEAYKLIEEGVKWLKIDYGKKIYYKSARTKEYYKVAEELINKGAAYVCHCKAEELRKYRREGVACGHRMLPPNVQLLRWKEMFTDEEGHSVLRLKTDMQDPNPAFRDRVLFKVSDREHPRSGTKIRVWPTLEMSWAVDDVKLGVTHVIRGNDLVMETQTEQFIWDVLGWEGPEIMHTGLVKVDVSGANVSKSKSRAQVKSGEFSGWDDPRTWSLQSLHRRGIKPEAFRAFVKELGVTKNDVTVPIETLYALNRTQVDHSAKRFSFVQDPKELKVDGAPYWKHVDVPVHPEKEATRRVMLGKKLYVSGEDWRASKGKTVRLLHLYNVRLPASGAKAVHMGESVEAKMKKVQWVSHHVPVEVIMPDGSSVEGIGEAGLEKLRRGDVVQFERFGFVRFDGVGRGKKVFWFAHK
jgi:glutamyl-tRNA synthetase